MLTRSGPSNTSGKSVTTLIVSIGLFHGHEVVAPRLHHRARVDPDERQQPLAMVSAPPRHDERPRHDVTLLVHDQQPRLGREQDRKSTRLNSSHTVISYAVFCLK